MLFDGSREAATFLASAAAAIAAAFMTAVDGGPAAPGGLTGLDLALVLATNDGASIMPALAEGLAEALVGVEVSVACAAVSSFAAFSSRSNEFVRVLLRGQDGSPASNMILPALRWRS
mmetsp:Transcript_9597/g.14044  ORF Transcript_9597/g.14044 Transcript_9597/m.14044 type:complete len:118 (-) Transcript_9597:1210-1563(-)